MTIKFDKSKLAKNLSKGNVLIPYLDKVFENFDEPWKFAYETKQSDDAWHPSGHCKPSPTELYAIATGKERDSISGSLRKSFMVGHYWHQLLQYVIVEKLGFARPEDIERRGKRVWQFGKSNPPWYDPHAPKPYHWVTGSGDIAPLVTKKWQGIVDIKTMSSNQFKRNSLPAWAADKYKCQINIYMELFEEEQGLILGVNKDAPHDFKEFRYERDQELIDAIYRKWQFVGHCLDSGEEPTEVDDDEFKLPL